MPGKDSKEGKNKNQILADLAMADARRMIQAWTPPVWDEGRRPRISLLRAKKAVPSADGTDLVDWSREERNLGWDMYDKNFFADVVDIEGHHYEVFKFEFIEDISNKMKKALDDLEWVALDG
ncbi:polyketide synthase [Fusarium sp. NRRL 52700]|nr:polyketide synthase [Fusarium sp. NRRL 52700]